MHFKHHLPNKRRFAALSAVLALAVGMSTGCSKSRKGDTDAKAGAKKAGAKDKPGAHWGYKGKEGAAHWGSLSPKFKACSEGKTQSPINLSNSRPDGALPKLNLNYRPFPVDLQDNGHSLVANAPKGLTMSVGGQTFEMLSFHYHTGSEHTIDGKQAPMEIHFVHKEKSSGGLGVLGVMVQPGAANPQLQLLIDNLPGPMASKKAPGHNIDPAGLLPAQRDYFAYDGSLTTPPCSEGVKWHVLKDPITATDKQIKSFRAIHGDNFRPVQPLNGRVIRIAPATM